MLLMLIPWSLGWQRGTDPLLARTLFWFTGHPIVYFWLLPTYVSWYTLVPRQAGANCLATLWHVGRSFSSCSCLHRWGLHHQFTDPGIGQGWKLTHAFLTFAVFFPSLLTFFNVVASPGKRRPARGGRGLLAWFAKLPWSDPSVTAQVLAMLLFAFGGIGGLVNASYSLNLVVHNTAYIVGHFHLTVGTAVTLSFMGITYWFVPVLRGRVSGVRVWRWFRAGSGLWHGGCFRLPCMTWASWGMPRAR